MKLQRAFFLVIALVFLVGFTLTISSGNKAAQRAQVAGSSGQVIRAFSLVNADTDTVIGPLTEGMIIDTSVIGTNHLNIVADTAPSTVGSVAFYLDQQARVVKNSPPYALGGHNNAGNFYAANLSPGEHILKAQTFTLSRGLGVAGEPSSVNFKVVGGSTDVNTNTTSTADTGATLAGAPTHTQVAGDNVASTHSAGQQEVISFTLVNADTDQDIMTIENGANISVQSVGTSNLTIRANTSPVNVGSVKFYINSVASRTDNLFQYTINAPTNTDDYVGWNYTPGQQYSITATPYTLSRGNGVEGVPLTVSFTIGETPTPSQSQGGSGSHAMNPSIPAMGCLTATVTNATSGGNPGTITIDWPDVAGYEKYKAWRIQNGQVEVSTENVGGAVTYSSMTPGTWTIRAAFLDPNAALNTNGDWGPESEISNLVISTSIPGPVTTTTCGQEPTEPASLKVFLGGPYDTTTGIMSSALNDANVIPLSEPYTATGYQFTNGAGSTISSSVLNATGSNAIVDWVIVELRDQNNNLSIVSSRPALLQADGEVVGLNGTSPIFESFSAGTYYVVVHHRNHLAVMTANPVNISNPVDLTNSTLWGTNAAKVINGVKVLWPGDVNNDNLVKYTGGSNDKDLILSAVGSTTPNNVLSNVYTTTDINMDNAVKYTGTKNDRDIIFQSINSPEPTTINVEQLPQPSPTSITSIQVVNTQGVVQQTLSAGQTINIGTQNGGYGTNIALKANASTSPVPGSVKFTLVRAGNTYENTDNSSPFSSHGDSGGNFTSWTGLQTGVYTLTVTPYDGANATGGQGTGVSFDFIVANNDTVPPPAPLNVSVNYRSGNEIRLSWDASVGAVNYMIYRTGTSSQTFGPQPGLTLIDNTGLTDTGTYSYQVSAVNANSQVSPYSVSISAPALLPAFPVGALVAPNANNTQVRVLPENSTLVGTVNTTNNGSIVTGTSPAGHVVWVKGVTPAPDVRYLRTTFTSPALSGPGWVDQTKLTTYVAQTVPNTPISISGTAASTTSIDLQWVATNVTNETYFELQRAASTDPNFNSPTAITPNPGVDQSSATASGLSASTGYYFRVRAVNAVGPSTGWATSGLVTTQAVVVSGAFPPTVTSGSTTCNAGSMPANTADTGGTSGSGVIAAQSVLLGSSYNTTNANDPTITICWAGFSGRTSSAGKIERRETETGALSSSSWTQLATNLNLSTSGSYTDNTVESNKLYEYRVSSGSTGTISSYISGYIATGIEVPMPAYNGEIVLVFANDIATGTDGSAPTTFGSTTLNTQINQLIADLQGDKWTVDYAYVTKHMTGSDTPSTVRTKILARSGSNTKAVYLIGNVPIPMIGDVNPDGHANRVYSSDMMYSDMNETWSNTGCTLTWSPQWAQIDNPSSTYKFCKTSATPELQVGRIDMFDMPGYGDEKTLLEGYLSRMHETKIATATYLIPENAYFENDLDTWPNTYKVNRDMWNDITSVVGPFTGSNVTIEPANPASYNSAASTPMTQGTNYGFVHHGSSAGSCNFRVDVGVITPLAPGGWSLASSASIPGSSTGWTGVFNISGMSYMGEFGCENNLLRGMLAKGRGANSMYSLRRFIYWHTMGMGKTIGSSYFNTTAGNASNNTSALYQPYSWSDNGYNINGTTTLMGDPTMRLSYIKPATNLSVVNSGGQPSMTWTAPSGTTVDGYLVYKITASDIQRISGLVTGTSWNENTTFVSGTKYMVTAVKKKNSLGGGQYWNESLGTIYTTTGGGGGDVQAPSTPGSFAISTTTPPTASSITLTWSASTGNPVGESVTYNILRSTSTNGAYASVGTDTASPFTDSTGLVAGTTYYYRITASDAASNTSAPAPSATTGISATTVDNQAPSAPSGLYSPLQTTSSISLAWNASTGVPAGEAITYKVFRSTSTNGTYTQVGGNITAPTVTYIDSTGLTAGTTYYYKVSATDTAGNSFGQVPVGGYAIATLAPSDTQPPTVPTGLQVTGTTSSSISLSWNASTDVGGSAVQGYIIYRSTTSGGTYTSVGAASGTSYTDSVGLTASTTYYYKITSIDNSQSGNESAQTAYVSGTTTASTGGGAGQVLGLMGVYAGPNNTEDVTPGANPVGAVDFYVDCVAGDDTRAGTSAATAWKTMDKFNSSGAGQMVPGSRAFFKRGCKFYKTDVAPMPVDEAGILTVSRSGTASNYIEYKAYGTGSAPVISGAIPVTGWTLHSGNIYKANIGANKNVRFLFANDADQTIARTPNKATDGSTVYMRTDSITSNTNATLTVTDSTSTDGSLPSSGTLNLTGGEYSARFLNWSYVVVPISAHSGQTITAAFPAGTNLPCYYPDCTDSVLPKAGWGYFVQNKLALLDTAGEWYYDNATGYVYFWAPGGVNPSTMTVEAAVHRNGIKLYGNIERVKIKNLVFEKFNKFSYGGGDKGAAVFIQDWDTASTGTLSNIVENVEIKNTPIGVRVEGVKSTGPSNGNKILNSYIHDIYDIGILSYGIGNLFQGNVIENVALDPAKFGDGEEWNKAYAVVSTGGDSDTISNVIRNIGYIGVNYVANGEIRNNLIENVSMAINDGCGACGDGSLNGLLIKRNVVNHAFGNTVGLPPTFIHNTPLGSGISTGDRNSIGGIFTENVVNDFGNSGMTFDNNMLSDNMTMSDNIIYTAQQGNERGARGISMYDQSVGVYHPGENNSVAGFDYTFNHKIYGNKVYTLHTKNISLSEVTINGNNGTVADFGDYWGNYFFHPHTLSSIMLDRRSIQFKTGDYVWALDATVPVYTTATGQTQVSGSPVVQHTKGYISGSESNYRWFVTFNGSAPDGWVDSWRMEQALRTPAEFDTVGGYPPAGQPADTGPGYTTTNMPTLYVNTTGLPMSVNIGTGKCGSDGQPLVNPYPLNTFADAIVPEVCSEQPQ